MAVNPPTGAQAQAQFVLVDWAARPSRLDARRCARRTLTVRIEIRDYDAAWPRLYEREAARVRRALGERVIRLEHCGSTSVPGLTAKAVVDIVLEVRASSREAEYVPDLERAGYRLRRREPEWFEHRLLRSPEAPVNLHVFTAGCEEVDRMLRFRDRLRANAADRERYAREKRALAGRTWGSVQQYADAKTEVIRAILAHAGAEGDSAADGE